MFSVIAVIAATDLPVWAQIMVILGVLLLLVTLEHTTKSWDAEFRLNNVFEDVDVDLDIEDSLDVDDEDISGKTS